MQSCSIARLCWYMAILGGQKKSSSLVTKDFSTAQYSPEESVLAPICAPRVTPDPELLPSLLIYIGLRTYVGRLYYEAYYTTLAILICREGSFRIKLQTKYKHLMHDALYTLSLPHPTTEISWLMLACLFRCSKMPPVYLENLLDNFFKYSSNALKCLL